jgi:hypothetical protein
MGQITLSDRVVRVYANSFVCNIRGKRRQRRRSSIGVKLTGHSLGLRGNAVSFYIVPLPACR